MQARCTGTIVAVFATLLVPFAARAQSRVQTPASATDAASAARAEALANVVANRSAVIRGTVDRWRSEFGPRSPSQNIDGGEADFIGLLERASSERLLAASQAETYAEAVSSLRPSRQGPDVINLEPGRPMPQLLGDAGADLVFTPVTPCRIVDTRIATVNTRIGPNVGRQFSVSLADFTPQGGAATSCGIPFAPAAVSVNIVSTDQTGVGNLRAVQTGGGVPNAAFVNYTPGLTIANAGVVRVAGATGSSNLFIYSAAAESHVVVDIMGYFAAPEATPLGTTAVQQAWSLAAGAILNTVASCPAGYAVTGGGNNYNNGTFLDFWLWQTSKDAGGQGWRCRGYNNSGGTQSGYCEAICSRVPGR
jgi:hypothetical protein